MLDRRLAGPWSRRHGSARPHHSGPGWRGREVGGRGRGEGGGRGGATRDRRVENKSQAVLVSMSVENGRSVEVLVVIY